MKTRSARGDPIIACVLRDPIPLTRGKTALHEFSAACEFFPMLRALGHIGVVINHDRFGRAVYTALARVLTQRHLLYYDLKSGGSASARLLDRDGKLNPEEFYIALFLVCSAGSHRHLRRPRRLNCR